MSPGVRRIAFAFLFVTFLPDALAVAPTSAQLDQARKTGLAWLVTHQSGDGSWKSANGMAVQPTAAALDALANAGIKQGYVYSAAQAWLGNTDGASIDSLARKTIALYHSNANVAPLISTLLAQRNDQYKAWGAYPKYQASFPDSALALDAILVSGATYTDTGTTLGYIAARQNGDGGWPYLSLVGTTSPLSTPSRLIPTGYNLLVLSHARAKGWAVDSYITNSVNWLVNPVNSQVKSDGGFAEDPLATTGSPLETALVYLALSQAKAVGNAAAVAAQSTFDNASTFLINNQGTDGSWGSDPFATALALQTLPATVLADSNKNGVPDVVETYLNMNSGTPHNLATGNGQSISGTTTAKLLASAIQFQSLNLALAANGAAPYIWSITSGYLPDGLSLNAITGQISGMPTSVGNFSFSYTVTDATGATSTTVGQIDILRAPADGDLNGDGVVDVADVALAERFALGLAVPTAAQMAHGDVAPAGNPDGVIDAADVARIRRKALGLEAF